MIDKLYIHDEFIMAKFTIINNRRDFTNICLRALRYCIRAFF